MEVERLAVAFVQILRGLGVEVSVDSTLLYARALALLGIGDPSAVYWAGRCTLIRSAEDRAGYDLAFGAFWWRQGAEVSVITAPLEAPAVPGMATPGEELLDRDEEPGAPPARRASWSPSEVLRERDFASYTDAELEESRRLMKDVSLATATRRSRRSVATRRKRGNPDLRRTLSASMRTGGEPVLPVFRKAGTRRRRLLLLLDVSGSMEPYARAFVALLNAAVVSRRGVEAFAMGTRLTRVTRELRSRDPDAAMAAAARSVVDWAGGTRLGECVREFNVTWGLPGMGRGAVVVIVSDGWDRGAPELLREQMERLRRVAHRVIWVNPLKASPGYEPLAAGMAAAMPYVDELVEGHSLEAFEKLGEIISR